MFTNNGGESVDTGTHCEPTVDGVCAAILVGWVLIGIALFFTAVYFS